MATDDPNSAIQVTGRLSYGCTDLAAEWPHGGIGLGLVGGIFLSPPRAWAALPQEETNSASEVLWLGGDLTMGFTVRGWDDDAMRVIFPGGAFSGTDWIADFPGTLTPGAPVATITNLVFTPRNQLEHPGIVIPKAAVLPDVNMQLLFSAYRYLEKPAVVIALPDANGRLGQFGKFSKLSV